MTSSHKIFMLAQIKHILIYVEEHPESDPEKAKLEWVKLYAKLFRDNWDINMMCLSKNIYNEDKNDKI